MLLVILTITAIVVIVLAFHGEKVKERKHVEQEKENQKLEKQKIKEEEELKVKIESELEKDLKNNLSSLNNILANLGSMNKLLTDFLELFNIDISLNNIYNTLLEVYKIGNNANNILEFKKEINEKAYRIMKYKLKVDLQEKVNKQYLSLSILESLESSIKLYCDKNTEDILMYELLTGVSEVIPELIESANDGTLKSSNIQEVEYKKFTLMKQGLLYVYFYIVSLVKILILSKDRIKIERNSEFYKIQKNLFAQFDISDMMSKLYPIYSEFYKEINSYIYNEKELQVIIYLINKNESKDLNLTESFESIIKENNNLYGTLNKSLDIGLIDKFEQDINYESILEVIKGFITVTFNIHNFNEENLIKNIYREIIEEMKDNLSVKEIFILYQEVDSATKDIKKFIERQNLIKDKERFFNGNFDKEIAKENEKLKFDSIKTGIEFEEYLKHVFEQIGYIVQLTKITGDQGADLIITKNNVKTVVQAKFYSKPVGNKAVQEVVSAIKYYNADKGMVVTNNCYTKSASELADANDIILWDGDILKQKVEQLYCC